MENQRILIYENEEVIKKSIRRILMKRLHSLLAKVNSVIALMSEFDETFKDISTTTAKYTKLLSVGT